MKNWRDVVFVVWNDAHSSLTDEGGSIHRPWLTQSVGFLINSDEEGVTLSTDVTEKFGAIEQSGRIVHFVPRGCIVEERILKRGKTA